MPACKTSLNRVNSQEEVCYKSWWLEACKEHTAVLLPWTEEIQLRFTGHRAEKCRLPPPQKNKKGLHLFCRKKKKKKNTRLGKEETHFKPKDAKTPKGSAHASPKGQAARQTMQESPCRIPTSFFFFIRFGLHLRHSSAEQANTAIRRERYPSPRGEEHQLKTPGLPNRLRDTSRWPGFTEAAVGAFVLTNSEERLGVQTFPCSICNPNIAALS